ncbi:hypothetical protein MGG_06237 [Pyricularia oryzae 70-15]|uniref:SET domain-containing protein n=3 Tax=Pyricularia oryzae TaxID=318829 RepID=G4N8I9_PYRO7|nr:uncharacterized protein MGG_06237 [Pyricularia oryzae 70-15]EHA51037.1 hypothetical protein MGG_06237 [Pyricularia oryzae 70-15]ELQ34683.1 hypothetical protein OOU_Y34scaffold00748g2 [Pyricularia oryzae Y34]KAI7921713.1 hypothetical protein M9X92_005238 [Pyricularia oryzae]KAI7921861.1 hypothetical protein M0657_005919 [Pyricularia oryzae]
MSTANDKRFATLVEWNKANGGRLNPAVEVYNDLITKVSLRAKEAVTPDADGHCATVSCPLSTTLSVLNALTGSPLSTSTSGENGSPAQSPPAFPDYFLQNVPPHVVSRFFLIQQYLLGPKSHWHPYIASLPQPEHLASWNLPPFWPEEDAAVLAATNAGVAAKEMAGIAGRESKQGRRALRESGLENWREYSPLLYRWAYCIFTSRSFRPSLVVPPAVWESLRNEHAKYLDGCEMDDFSILMPLFDIANHDPLVQATWDSESVPGECRLLVNGRSGQGYRPGEQIFNNYGLKTNSELLVAYGFVLSESDDLQNEYFHVRLQTQGPADETTGKRPTIPRDFLISLDPLSSPRSVVGRARQWIHDRQGLRKDFDHCEDALLWAFCEVYLQVQGLDHGAKVARLASILADSSPAEHEQLIESLRDFFVNKLEFDYAKISAGGSEAMRTLLAKRRNAKEAEGSTSGNQDLAMRYLTAVLRVIQIAMVTLDPSIEFQYTPEEGEE